MFKRKIKKSVGLEINSSYLRVVELQEEDGIAKVASANELELDEGIVSGGLIRDKKALAKSLKLLLQKAQPRPIKIGDLHFALPDELVYVALLRGQIDDSRGVKQIVEEEYPKNIPIKKGDSEYSYKVLEKQRAKGGGEQTEVLLLAALKKSLLAWQNFLEENGFKIDYFDVDILATHRAIAKETDETIAFLLVKEDYSRFAVFSKHGLEYEYALRFGRKSISTSMAPKEELAHGSVTENASIQGLVEDLQENIEYFESSENAQNRKLKVSQVLLCGNSLELEYLQEYFKKYGKLGELKIAGNSIDKSFTDTKYNQVIGLALRPWTHVYEKTDPFLPCIGHAYSLETTIKNKEENVIQFFYKIKNTVLLPLFLLGLVFIGWLFFGLIQGSQEAERKTDQAVKETPPLEEPEEIIGSGDKDEEGDVFIRVNDIGIPLNVRGGPGTGYPIIGQVNPGSEQVYIKEEEGWYNIEWPNEENAWISGAYAVIVD